MRGTMTHKKRGVSTTQRTIAHLRAQGITCGVVERFNPHVGEFGIRQDLFGIIDIIALDHTRGIIGIQTCSGSGVAAHRNKLLVEKGANSIDWLRTPGAKLEIMGWRKLKVKRGGKAMRWVPKIEEITLLDFPPYRF